jgi:hypothetical protein
MVFASVRFLPQKEQFMTVVILVVGGFGVLLIVGFSHSGFWAGPPNVASA